MRNSSTPTHNDPHSHDRFAELCALATSGSLTDEEWSHLQAHFVTCTSCREQVQEYREIARTGMALLMPEQASEEQKQLPPDDTGAWSIEAAKEELFARIASGDVTSQYSLRSRPASQVEHRWWNRFVPHHPPAGLRYAAAAMLAAALIMSAYRVGTREGERLAEKTVPVSVDVPRTDTDQLSAERDAIKASLVSKNEELSRVSEELQRERTRVERLASQEARTAQDLQTRNASIAELQAHQASVLAELDSVRTKLQQSESALQAARERYDALQTERSREASAAELQRRVDELTARLAESETSLEEARQTIAHSRDVRELMGARELYIADVFDVDDRGNKEKPFGRLFYTKGKSLVFYAFDLDQQQKVQNASIFQVWGRRGFTDKQPLSMGAFNLDNELKKRWVLQFDDPKALAQIDAVFVTVEPPGGSKKPRGRQLLFASLRAMPNHP